MKRKIPTLNLDNEEDKNSNPETREKNCKQTSKLFTAVLTSKFIVGEFTNIYNTAKKDSRKLIDQLIGIKVDILDAAGKGGTTTNGNVC